MNALAGVAVACLIALAPAARAAQTPAAGATARRQFEDGHFADAAATLQTALRADPDDAALYFQLGLCYFELREFDQASNSLEKAVKLNARISDYHLWLGRTYGRLAETRHSLWLGLKTRKEFSQAVELDPKNVPARRDLTEFYTTAPWIVGGSKGKAREQIAAISGLDPIQGALAQAEFDRQTGNQAAAVARYRQLLREDPPQPVEYFEIADFFVRLGDAAAVQAAVDGVVRVAPRDPRIEYYRGVILTLRGQDLDEAGRYLKAYLAATVDRSNYPPHADARTWLGHVYEKLGRRLEAAEQYRAALDLDPNSSFAKQSLKRLEKQ